MTEADPKGSHIQPVLELFRSNVVAFWATTYNIDLSLFNEFLLKRLGEPPLNIAILADPERLATTLGRIPAAKTDQVKLINSRWLLRGAQMGRGRFHSKSYLALTPTKATLLIGSGNLSRSGLDEGREVFTEFLGGTAAGDNAIAVWRSWMRRVVESIDDTCLAERFADLESKFPKTNEPRTLTDPAILHNLDESISEQFVTALGKSATSHVDELLVAAPFFDQNALALKGIIERLRPRGISVYTTSSTSVDGPQLASVLQGSGAEVRIFRYEPDRFTHAKLIAVIDGSRAWVLSGSANLSRAALDVIATEGNVELSVLTSAKPDQVRALFVSPDSTAPPLSLADVSVLTYSSSPESATFHVRLLRATARPDGCIEVQCDSQCLVGWQLDDLEERSNLVEVDGRTRTSSPLGGRLVQIVADDGTVLSNRTVVDDPEALSAVMDERSRAEIDKPRELLFDDSDSPLFRGLVFLHRNFVMDVAENVSAGAVSGGIGVTDSDSITDDDLWERLERERLGRDHRVNSYGRIFGDPARQEASESILGLLEAMRDRAPSFDEKGQAVRGDSRLALLQSRADPREATDPQKERDESPGNRWISETRVRVRARNVLRRWAAAQTDPRLVWIDQLAPAGNFVLVANLFKQLWYDIADDPECCELRTDDLNDLWLDWMRPFVGTGRSDGWLDRQDPTVFAISGGLPLDLPQTVSALCWLALRHQGRDKMITWQPILNAALRHGLLEPSDKTVRFVESVAHCSLMRTDVDSDLLRCIEFIDDELWCKRISEEFGFEVLRLEAVSGGQEIDVRIIVRGVDNPLGDPRIPQLIVAARQYRRCDGVAIFSEDAPWRLVVNTGRPAWFRQGDDGESPLESSEMSIGLLEQIAATGNVLEGLFSRNRVA